MSSNHPIPARLNLALSVLSMGGCVGLLYWASHALVLWHRALAVGLFAFLANTVFALLHEAVHRILHPVPWINEMVGVPLAAMFPTSLAFQRACHLGHHRRNRTDSELFDQYRPADSRILKSIQFYGIFTGFYWPIVPIGCALTALFPWVPRRMARLKEETQEQTGTVAMLGGIARTSMIRIQLEALFALALHGSLIWFGVVTFKVWLVCYLTFGWIWGSLQYADHAFSIRDIREGAWNLKVSTPIRWIFLNYHLHLNHHRHPEVPWIHLPKLVQEADPFPSFWKIYLRMWRGPQPAEPMASAFPDHALERILEVQG